MNRAPRPVAMTLNLAPMVDVMMCLIIFFLLASRIVDAEHRPVALPFAESAQELDRGEVGARVVINIRPAADGDETKAEYVVSDWDGKRILERVLPPEDVHNYLETRAARATLVRQELRCVIRADRQVHYGQVEVVLRACGLAGIRKIVFGANAGFEPGDVP